MPLLLMAIAATDLGVAQAIASSPSPSSSPGPLPPRPPVPPGSSLRGNRDVVLATGSDGRLFDSGERRGFSLYLRLGEAQVCVRRRCIATGISLQWYASPLAASLRLSLAP